MVALAAGLHDVDRILGVLRDEQVAAGLVLGDGVAGEDDLVAAEQREEPGLQPGVAREQHRRLAEHGGAEDQRQSGVDGRELLERDGHAELAVAEAAELLRDDQTGQTEVVALLDQVPVEVGRVGLVEGADRRCDPLLAPAADLLLEGRDVRRDGGEGGDVERRVERGGHDVTALRR